MNNLRAMSGAGAGDVADLADVVQRQPRVEGDAVDGPLVHLDEKTTPSWNVLSIGLTARVLDDDLELEEAAQGQRVRLQKVAHGLGVDGVGGRPEGVGEEARRRRFVGLQQVGAVAPDRVPVAAPAFVPARQGNLFPQLQNAIKHSNIWNDPGTKCIPFLFDLVLPD